jgi:hypothetical protein
MKKAGKSYEFKVYTTRDRDSRIRNYARYVCDNLETLEDTREVLHT